MAGIRDIKRQIQSVQNTQKITKAMKMVSAAKMRKANDAMVATRPYSDKIREVAQNLSRRVEEGSAHPYMQTAEEVKTIGILMINSDRGLCGSFNSGVVKQVVKIQQENPDKEFKFFIVGKNAFDYFKKRSTPVLKQWTSFGGKVTYSTAQNISKAVSEAFLDKEIDELQLVFNEFRSTAFQVPKAEKILPLSFEAGGEEQELTDYIFEPDPASLLKELLPRYVVFYVYHALLESSAGEHGARMVAMDNATRSADDMIKKLTLNYNKARQAAITTDLLDIVNGAEALK